MTDSRAPLISVITAVHNRVSTVGQAVRSVRDQTYPWVEHLIIDGGSTDGTVELARREGNARVEVISEPDDGIYHALNKGIEKSRGEIVGLMHSDDFFADRDVLARVVDRFTDPSVDGVYGDLQYVSKSDTAEIVRHWRAGPYSPAALKRGWMPPHPTLFLRRRVFDTWGLYDTSYEIAADYEAVLRYCGKGELRLAYIPEVLVKMRMGGESNRSLSRIIRKTYEDYRALRANEVGGIGVLISKNLSKVRQFFVRSTSTR